MHSKTIPRTGVAAANPNPIVPRRRAGGIRAPARARRRRQPGGTPPQPDKKAFHLADHPPQVARAGKFGGGPVAVLPGIAIAGPRTGAHGPAMHAATLSAIDGGRSAGRALPGPCSAAGRMVHRFGIATMRRAPTTA
jgi:hypothetical protein